MGALLFGLGIPPAAVPGADPIGAARAAEELGFDFVGTNDHLHGSGPSLDGMEEAIRIVQGMWARRASPSPGACTGPRAPGIEPKPDRHIPIWLGTYGNRALAAARDPQRSPAPTTWHPGR